MEIDATKLTSAQKAIIYAILSLLGLVYGSAIFKIAASAAMNIMVIIGCGFALAGGIFVLPWLKVKMENFVLKKIKEEIKKHPIEYLQNDYAAAEISFDEQAKVIDDLKTTKDVFISRHNDYKKKHGEDEPEMLNSITIMEGVISELGEALKISKRDLDELRIIVEKETDKYRMAEGLTEATSKAMKAVGKKDSLLPFLRSEALAAAQDKFYGSLSSVKNLADRTNRQLNFKPERKEKLITQE